MSHTHHVSEWITNLHWHDLPADVIDKAKWCLKDYLACVAGGARSTPGRITANLALNWGGPQEATIVGCSERVVARHAAFANATMANALDYDDTFHGHPGATTFPTVLASAEKWGGSGQDMLVAVVVGYELSIRAMGLMQPLIPRYRSMWDLGTLQAFGAAAAAARIAGCSAANALGLITATTPVPLPRKQRYENEGRSMVKSAYGWAADAAIVAAELTLSGFTGPGHALDDNLGFWESHPSSRLNVENFSDKLGERWQILEVEFKPYMACRFIHPVLQAVETLMHEHPISADMIECIDVHSFSILADEHHYILEPNSGTDAQFSVPYTVAAMIQHGGLSPDSYEETALREHTILDLARRVQVNVSRQYDAAYPTKLGADVEITFKDGTSANTSVDHPKGSVGQMLTESERTAKFHSLVDPLLGRPRSEEIASALDRIETLADVGEFTSLLRPA